MPPKNKHVGTKREVIIRLVDDGVLLVEKQGNVVRIRRSDLNRLIETTRLPTEK